MLKRLAVLVLLVLPLPVRAQDLPARTNLYVNDGADLMTPAQETRLSLKLAQLHLSDGVEMSVLTLPTRADFARGRDTTMENFAYEIFEAWKLGHDSGRDGILVLILWDDAEMRIELGEAYGTAFNATAADVIDTRFVPGLRDGDRGVAIIEGSEAVIDRIALAETPDIPNDTAAPDTGNAPAPDSGTDGNRRRVSGHNG